MTNATATPIGLELDPLDVLFFRGGRPFTGAERSVSGLPLPQTFAGAVRTVLLRAADCDFGRLAAAMRNGGSFADAVERSCCADYHAIGRVAVRGPWLARRSGESGRSEVLVPAPSALRREKGEPGKLHRMSPLSREQELPGWNPPEDRRGLRPLWIECLGPTEEVSGYLTARGLEEFLQGGEVRPDDIVSQEDLFGLDYRTGIGISPDRLVADESQIFGRGFLALKENVFFYAEVLLPDETPDGLVSGMKALPFGGEGRHVVVRRVEQPFIWPQVELNDKHKPMLLLTTPCAFEDGWKSRCLDGHLVSAAVPGSVAFSGWDLARHGPKPTRFAVQAGSVYFLQSLPKNCPQSLAENDEERQQGWGCCLKGVWTHE